MTHINDTFDTYCLISSEIQFKNEMICFILNCIQIFVIGTFLLFELTCRNLINKIIKHPDETVHLIKNDDTLPPYDYLPSYDTINK
jgi:hypothetical protein